MPVSKNEPPYLLSANSLCALHADLPGGIQDARVVLPAQQHLVGGAWLGGLKHEVLPQTNPHDARNDDLFWLNLVRVELALAAEQEVLSRLRGLEGRGNGGDVGLVLHLLQPRRNALVHNHLLLSLLLGRPIGLCVI